MGIIEEYGDEDLIVWWGEAEREVRRVQVGGPIRELNIKALRLDYYSRYRSMTDGVFTHEMTATINHVVGPYVPFFSGDVGPTTSKVLDIHPTRED